MPTDRYNTMESHYVTHLHGCKIKPCKCSPNSRLLLLEYIRDVHKEDPVVVAQMTREIEILRKIAVMYTQSPHLFTQ